MRSARLISAVSSAGWRSKAEAEMDGRQQPVLEVLVVEADGRLERADQVADHIFGRIVEEGSSRPSRPVRGRNSPRVLDQHAVLGHERHANPWSGRSSGPPGQPMGNILDFDIERRRIEKVQAAAAQHPLPGAAFLVMAGMYFCSGSLP